MDMKDPVCGMEAGGSSRFRSNYKGKTFFFCSESCKDRFDKEPDSYA
ncbi:MAG: YHS domain-containing protein [Candidatus Marsarchaeota archaeon]|nr:YHS domain-containing protein [Candidatus Marsarchaeota archaeon]MCL5412948.1 YHS domain-containing protein [Candidatus Marsarchaeota archaeon]